MLLKFFIKGIKKMKKVILLGIICLIFSCCATSRITTSSDGITYILYDNTNILNWDDFKEKPNYDSSINGKLSVTIYLIEGTNVWLGNQYYEAHGAILPYESWIKENKHSDYYLKHFQTL